MAEAQRVVAVDGPAGSGKTTLGRRLGLALGLPLIDTGLFYRGLTVAALRAGIGADDAASLARLAADVDIELNTDPAASAASSWTVRVDGRDASVDARNPAQALLLSRVSGVPGVRAALLPRQRALAEAGGAVAVGRDCGTVVFPGAPVKLYLEAAGAVRTRRRAAQLHGRGWQVDPTAVEADVIGRDASDRGNADDVLRAASDAHHLDTGAMDADAVAAEALALCRRAGILTPSSG